MKLGSLHTQQDADRFCAQSDAGRMAISDLRVRGLQLERMATGRTKWRLRFAAPDGRGRICMTLGDASILSLVDARQLAEKLLRDAALGIDPRYEREQLRKVPTFADFIGGWSIFRDAVLTGRLAGAALGLLGVSAPDRM